MEPHVSILTPIYNAVAFLSEAIESVLSQNYSSWELLLTDDGSTDGGRELAQLWSTRDPRLRFLAHPFGAHCGSSATRNLAFSMARGELIAMLDADDVWLPGKLKFQVDTLESQPGAALTWGAAERWYSWDSASEAKDYTVSVALPDIGGDQLIPGVELLRAFVEDESLTPCTCATLFRRDAIQENDAFDASFPGVYDDQVLLAKICLQYDVYPTSRCVARYRKHSRSCCAIADRNGHGERERRRFLEWLDRYERLCVGSF